MVIGPWSYFLFIFLLVIRSSLGSLPHNMHVLALIQEADSVLISGYLFVVVQPIFGLYRRFWIVNTGWNRESGDGRDLDGFRVRDGFRVHDILSIPFSIR
jgi:hypothetical protein